MTQVLRAPVLLPGLATGIGSLPHTDPVEAADVVLRLLPELPAAPQLPERDPREGMLAQWLGALPEVTVAPTVRTKSSAPPTPRPNAASTRLRTGVCSRSSTAPWPARSPNGSRCSSPVRSPSAARSKHRVFPPRARSVGARAARDWAAAIEALVATRLPGAGLVVFFDEPALVRWRRGDTTLERDAAIDVLSGALAAVDSPVGVHVCGDGDVGLAAAAGPQVLGVTVGDDLAEHALPLSRFLDGEGWVAWGAVPTDRPVGESVDPHWRRLAAVWCELARRGCDPVVLRTRGLVTPACGLAGYGASQAERVLGIAHELAGRVHDQAVAARLTLGA